jgi:leucyl-tRNA synthetase
MHVGHVRNYTIGDAISRFYRMSGYNVLHPMGWDAFGLPAENYAITSGISPREAIDKNTKHFKQQLIQMGFGYDWSREIDSTKPEYYKWTQWFFLFLYKRGLAYQQESLQWWCPKDKTVLANEQVEVGVCWRCGTVVEKKALKQWFFKITEYADALDKDLDNVNWSDSIKSMQRNWIGKSIGSEVDFAVVDSKTKITVYTTRIDTIYGATFLVIAPENEMVKRITTTDQKVKVEAYIKTVQSKSEIERQETDRKKTGVFSGSYAINPANQRKIPIWIADYVLDGYGTGAIMAVPGHDQRDKDFALTFNLPIIEVIEPVYGEPKGDDIHKDKIIAAVYNPKNDKVIVLDWGPRQDRFGGHMLIGGSVEENEDIIDTAKREIQEETGYSDLKFVRKLDARGHGYFYSNVKNKNYCGHCTGMLFELNSNKQSELSLDEGEKNKFSLKWIDKDKVAGMLDDGIHETFYRQLVLGECYEGEGIMINSQSYDGLDSSAMRDKILIDLSKSKVARTTVNYKMRDWLISRQRYWGAPIPIIHCPDDGAVPVPEDQLPVLLPAMDKFEPGSNGKSPLANQLDFVNTTCPKCGKPAKRETDTMDGFACSSWYFLRFADPHNDNKPFDKTIVDQWLPVDDYIGGAEHAVMHLLYARFWTKVMFDADLIDFNEPFQTLRNQGMILAPDGSKMSKSKNNTVNPDTLIDQGYGADSIRIMELFIGPWNQSANWSTEGLGGTFRFLQRTWNLVNEFLESDKTKNDHIHEDELRYLINYNIKKISEDFLNLSFNTAVAAQMECLNKLYKLKDENHFSNHSTWQYVIRTIIQLLAPFAPHIAEELWHEIGEASSVHASNWPVHEEKYLVRQQMIIVVQINGKLTYQFETSSDNNQDEIVELAKNESKVSDKLAGKEIKKTVYVPGRLVNFVV